MVPNDEYRRRAEDCMLLVRLMSSEADRRMMSNAARRWQTLAGFRDVAGAPRAPHELQPAERKSEFLPS